MLQVKRREWQFAGSTDVNAYYSQKVNGLFIPAAVLDKPFFSPEFDSARNYGSIGSQFTCCTGTKVQILTLLLLLLGMPR